jgi:hypothetical protein
MDAATLRIGQDGSRGLARREGNATRRDPLLRSTLALVEDVATRGTLRAETSGFSPDFQVCFPYRGFFVYHVGADDVVSDANQVVFVSSGEP